MFRLLWIALLLPFSACSTIEKNNCFYSLKSATYKTITKPVVIGSPTSGKMTTIPAEFGVITETLIIREATTETVRVPAVYRAIDGKRILVEEERFMTRHVPAVTKDVKRRVVITPAYKPETPKSPIVKYETRRVIDRPALTVVSGANGKTHKEFEDGQGFEAFQKEHNCSAR